MVLENKIEAPILALLRICRVLQEVFHQRFFGGLGSRMDAREVNAVIAKEVKELSFASP
jgi:hypothetical protein